MMGFLSSQFLLIGLSAVIIYSIVCRSRHFDDHSVWYVKAQHAALAISALLAVVVPLEWSAVCVAAGTVCFLLLGTSRWRHDAPAGITKPEARSDHPPAVIRYPWSGPP
jgi:hypothetical protein